MELPFDPAILLLGLYPKSPETPIQEAQRAPNKRDAKRPTPRCIIIKMSKVKDKEKILRAAREKKLVTYRGLP